jgi:acyl carrier protein
MKPIPTNDSLTFEEFKHIVAERLQVEEGKVIPEAAFMEDLMVDSIQLVDMFLRLEEMGIVIPLEEAWEVRTVGEAYEVYRKHTSSF